MLGNNHLKKIFGKDWSGQTKQTINTTQTSKRPQVETRPKHFYFFALQNTKYKNMLNSPIPLPVFTKHKVT